MTVSRAREGEARGAGQQLLDEERRLRHYEETGEWLSELPVRGTGLARIGNPLDVSDITNWLETNWKWVLGIGGGVALLIYLLKGK